MALCSFDRFTYISPRIVGAPDFSVDFFQTDMFTRQFYFFESPEIDLLLSLDLISR